MPNSTADSNCITTNVQEPEFVNPEAFADVLDRFKTVVVEYLAAPITIDVTTQDDKESYSLRATHVRGYYSSDYDADAVSAVKVTDAVIYHGDTGTYRWNTIREYHDTPGADDTDVRTRDVTVSMGLTPDITV